MTWILRQPFSLMKNWMCIPKLQLNMTAKIIKMMVNTLMTMLTDINIINMNSGKYIVLEI